MNKLLSAIALLTSIALFAVAVNAIDQANSSEFDVERSAEFEAILSCGSDEICPPPTAKVRYKRVSLVMTMFAVGELDHRKECVENSISPNAFALPIVQSLTPQGRDVQIGELQLIQVPANQFAGGEVPHRAALILQNDAKEIIGNREDVAIADVVKRALEPNYIYAVYDRATCEILEIATAFTQTEFGFGGTFGPAGYTGFHTSLQGGVNAYMGRLPDVRGFGSIRGKIIVQAPISTLSYDRLDDTFTGKMVESGIDSEGNPVFVPEIRKRGLITTLGMEDISDILPPIGSRP